MNREQIVGLLTEAQKSQIQGLDGIGKSEHFLGGPQLAGVTRNGQNIGWGQGMYKGVPVLQTTTDLENWKTVINTYKPDIFIEMGVANGGNVIFINDLLKEINIEAIIYGVDIEDNLNTASKSLQNFKFIKNSTLDLDVFNEINSLIQSNPDKRVLIHFDDCHLSPHVLQELNMYSEILKSNDVIIVGDTWDEGWYESPFKALVSFIENNDSI